VTVLSIAPVLFLVSVRWLLLRVHMVVTFLLHQTECLSLVGVHNLWQYHDRLVVEFLDGC
jgi:hypothetical protein